MAWPLSADERSVMGWAFESVQKAGVSRGVWHPIVAARWNVSGAPLRRRVSTPAPWRISRDELFSAAKREAERLRDMRTQEEARRARAAERSVAIEKAAQDYRLRKFNERCRLQRLNGQVELEIKNAREVSYAKGERERIASEAIRDTATRHGFDFGGPVSRQFEAALDSAFAWAENWNPTEGLGFGGFSDRI